MKGKEKYKQLTRSKPCCQLPTLSLTYVNNKIPFIGILCQSSFRSQFLGFILFLGVSFCRINLNNCSFSFLCRLVENKIYYFLKWTSSKALHPPLRWIYFVSTRIFICWSHGGFYHIFWPELTASFVGKMSNNIASRH